MFFGQNRRQVRSPRSGMDESEVKTVRGQRRGGQEACGVPCRWGGWYGAKNELGRSRVGQGGGEDRVWLPEREARSTREEGRQQWDHWCVEGLPRRPCSHTHVGLFFFCFGYYLCVWGGGASTMTGWGALFWVSIFFPPFPNHPKPPPTLVTTNPPPWVRLYPAFGCFRFIRETKCLTSTATFFFRDGLGGRLPKTTGKLICVRRGIPRARTDGTKWHRCPR